MLEQTTASNVTQEDTSSAPASWREWVDEHGNKLLLFARQQTRSLADAEDVLQEALIKLARKVHDGVFVGGQQAWLPFVYASIRRLAIDFGRKSDRRQKREDRVVQDEEIHNPSDDPWFESEGADDETRQLLEVYLKEIPAKFSEVIVLKIWGEQTFAEIGESLEISPNTAASRYRYGIEALRKKLEVAQNRGEF